MPKKGHGGGSPEAAPALEQTQNPQIAVVLHPIDVALEFNPTTREGDLVLAGADLLTEGTLKTAILISLFTDARADRDERLPVEDSDRRGWWGDSFAPIEGDRTGSDLWLLRREKLTPAVQSKAERACDRALEWLIADGIAAGVEVSSEIQKPDRLALLVVVDRPDGTRVEFSFSFVWEGVASGI